MGLTRKSLALGLMGILACTAILLPNLAAQEESARKVKDQVKPNYPELARRMNLSGAVKIEVLIAPDGKVKRTRVLGGHPVLANAAEDAAKRWKFEPGTKETTQVVEFKFTRRED